MLQLPNNRLIHKKIVYIMFEQSFKNIDNELHKDAGCSTEMNYIEQTSWLLFLKYLEDLENNLAMEAELNGKTIFSPVRFRKRK